jgi:repressor LexA
VPGCCAATRPSLAPSRSSAASAPRPPRAWPRPTHGAPPLVGEIAAGGPLLAEENIEDYLAVPEPLTAGGDEFLLRVKGESMIDAGILDGDYVVVQKQQTARDGDIVVALAGEDEAADEATVKRFFRENGRIRLQPENETLEPLYPTQVQILGKVIGVFRRV